MRDWIKGGLIGLILCIVLATLGFFIFAPNLLKLLVLSGSSGVRIVIPPALFGVMVLFIIIGAFIGWIIGKNKKNEEEFKN